MGGEVLSGAGERNSVGEGEKLLVFRCCGAETPNLPQYSGLRFDTRQLDPEFVFFMLCHLLNLGMKYKLFCVGTGCYVQDL